MQYIITHWKNLLIGVLALLLVLETIVIWQIPVAFKRITPGSFNQPGLPAGEAYSDSNSTRPAINLLVDLKGGFSINGTELIDNKKETLFHALIDTIEQSNNASLLIKIDQQVPYQSVAMVLDVAGRLGLTDISLQTIKP